MSKRWNEAISHVINGADFDVDDLLNIHRVLLEGTSEDRFGGVVVRFVSREDLPTVAQAARL